MKVQLVCHGCGTSVTPSGAGPFGCPRAGSNDDCDHVLEPVVDGTASAGAFGAENDEAHPFLRFADLMMAREVSGLSEVRFTERVHALDDAIAQVAGRGFEMTPLVASAGLGQVLGIERLWIKDETGGVGGSHKARHLFGLALALADSSERLAIASCGNAALAAAIVAKAAGRELDAYVPTHADERVLAELERLGAKLVFCTSESGDPAGDPCLHRMRAAVDEGAIPFTCQGTENALSIAGGQTLGWELIAQVAAAGLPPIGTVAIQVGGGALGSAVVRAFAEARRLGVIDRLPRFFPVQSEGAAPFERAWRHLALDGLRATGEMPEPTIAAPELAAQVHARRDDPAIRATVERAPRLRSRYMWPWESEPRSIATGILDDETYDWFALVRATLESGGWPVVVTESTLERAVALSREHTSIEVGATGAAGLAGLLDLAATGALEPGTDPLTARETTTVTLFTGRW